MKQKLRRFKDSVIKRGCVMSVIRYFTRTDYAILNESGINIIMVGTGSPMYDKIRIPQCIVVIAGGRYMVFDTGDGCARAMESLNLPLIKTSLVFLTHFHSDHTNGLGHLISYTWENGRDNPIDVYGPPGLEQVVNGFAKSASQDIEIRSGRQSLFPISPDLGVGRPHAFNYPDDGTSVVVWREKGLIVKAFKNDHVDCKISVGYRIEYAGRIVVISGDTRLCPFVIKNSMGADLLIHEVACKKLVFDIADLMEQRFGVKRRETAKKIRNVMQHHSDTLDVAQVARKAGVAKLVLTHIVPGIPNNFILKSIFKDGMSAIYKGPIVMANDGDRFYLPPKNREKD